MDDFKIIDELNQTKGYDIALFTTFNFDIHYFDCAIVRALENNGVKKISAFIDRDELNKATAETTDSAIGKKYVVSSIEINGAFHPKLVLLLGKSSAKLLVMSANLTVSGYCTNREIFNVFTYNEGSLENIGLIKTAVDFFVSLHELSGRQDMKLFDEISHLPYYRDNLPASEAVLLHNLTAPIFTQLTELIPDATQIDIAVPFYDNGLLALSGIKEHYPNAQINLYLQNKKSRIPYQDAIISGASACIFDKVEDKDSFYHGKVFRFVFDDQEYIVYGSTNCTSSAMLKTYEGGGNIECDVLEVGELGEFESFFEAFSLCSEVDHSFLPLTYTPAENCLFWFRYGKVEQEFIRLYIGYRELPSFLRVEWNHIEISYTLEGNTLVISLPYEQVTDNDTKLSISLSYGERIEIINCWYNDTILLSINRQKERKGDLYRFNPYSSGSEFYKDRRAILLWTAMTEEELLEEETVYAAMHPDAKEADPENDDSDDTDDGIVSYTIPPSDYYDKFEGYNHARSCCTILIQNYFGRNHSDSFSSSSVAPATHEPVPISEERRFVRFVKSRINSILKPEFIARDDFPRYWNGTHIFFNIFDKYCADPNTHNLFSPSYIAEAKARLLTALLQKSYTDEYIEDIKTMVFRTIVEGYLLTDINAANNQLTKTLYKELVRELDRRYDLRESYRKYIKDAFPFLPTASYSAVKEATSEVDELFGYLPLRKIFGVMMAIHGPGCNISVENGVITVNADAPDISNFMNLNRIQKYLGPLSEYARMKGSLSAAVITITNSKLYFARHDYAKQIVYRINLKKRRFAKQLLRASGRHDKPEQGQY